MCKCLLNWSLVILSCILIPYAIEELTSDMVRRSYMMVANEM